VIEDQRRRRVKRPEQVGRARRSVGGDAVLLAVRAQLAPVLLCEAGEDTPDGRVPDEILDSRSGVAARGSRFIWHQLQVTTEARPHNEPNAPRPRLVRYEQARVLGGGSSINGQLANRGAPTDYDEWHARGATGWNWDGVLPEGGMAVFRNDPSFEGIPAGSVASIAAHWYAQTGR